MNSRLPGRIVSAAVIAAIWVGLVVMRLPIYDLVTQDSAGYVECARSVVSGRGLLVRPWSGVWAPEWEPLRVWPPGFPLSMAPLIAAGMHPVLAGVTVSIISCAVFLIVLSRIALRLAPQPWALLLVSVVAAMPSFWSIGTKCWSDALFLALVGASLLTLIRWIESDGSAPGQIVFSGVFAGAAWWVRNAAFALFATTVAFLCISIVWIPKKRCMAALGCWSGAAVAVCLPLLVRNWTAFGALVPYQMPPSELTLWQNVRQAVLVVAGEMAGSMHIGRLASGSTVVLLVVLALALLAAVRLMRSGDRVVVLLVLYAVACVSLIVASRTRYRWGELINGRYMVQVYWVLWILLVYLVTRAVRSFAFRARIAVMGGMLLSACAIQASIHIRHSPAGRSYSESDLTGVAASLREQMKSSQVVMSTSSHLLRLWGDLNARQIAGSLDGGGASETIGAILKACESGRLWGLHIDRLEDVKRGLFGSDMQRLVTDAQTASLFVNQNVRGHILLRCR